MSDSDRLDALPENASYQPTPTEDAVMRRFFKSQPKPSSSATDGKLRVIMYAVIAFILLGNPWVGVVMSGIPYIGNSIVSFLVRTALFTVSLWAMLTFIKVKL